MKPLAGKRAFYAMGQRSFHYFTHRRASNQWPDWARNAYAQGYDDERFSGVLKTVKTRPVSKLAEAA